MARYHSQLDIHDIFDDLDNLRLFCRDHGFRFNEADLYNPRTFVWQQYMKFSAGKNCRNNWKEYRHGRRR
jgi:hypothetical protein